MTMAPTERPAWGADVVSRGNTAEICAPAAMQVSALTRSVCSVPTTAAESKAVSGRRNMPVSVETRNSDGSRARTGAGRVKSRGGTASTASIRQLVGDDRVDRAGIVTGIR